MSDCILQPLYEVHRWPPIWGSIQLSIDDDVVGDPSLLQEGMSHYW